MNCIKCGKESRDYPFRALQVITLHVRDFGKSSKVQTLGDFVEHTVCAGCAEEKYNARRNIGPAVKKLCLLYGGCILLGLVLAMLSWNGEGALRLGGLGLVVGGGMCLLGGVQNLRSRKQAVEAVSREQALYDCAWECFLEMAPNKEDINDITYIPVNEETLARKNGDLMILYDLVPQIAVEAHKRIHAEQ